MEKLTGWIKAHKALAIALAIGVVVLLWLMLRGGSSSANNGTSALAAYYGAEGQSVAAGAAVANSANALQASSNQTNASAATAAAYIAALQHIADTQAGTQGAAINAQETIDLAAIAAAKPQTVATPVSSADFLSFNEAEQIYQQTAGQPSYKQLDAVFAALQQADAVRAADLSAKGIKVA